MVALATADWLQGEREARGGEPVGWRRWRRQLLEQRRDKVIVLAQAWYGRLPLAACALLAGGKRTDVPPGMGTRHDVLATDRLTGHD
jgi:hypothetical protein